MTHETCAYCNGWVNTDNCHDVLKTTHGRTVYAHHDWCSGRYQEAVNAELVETRCRDRNPDARLHNGG